VAYLTDAMGRPIPEQIPPTSKWESVAIYDKPSIALRMMFEGPTLEGFRNLALNPDRLSPTQRQTLASRLQEAAGSPRGESRFVDAVVGAALNPLVWLGLLATAPAVGLLRKGSSVLGPSVARGAAFREGLEVSAALGMQSTEQLAQGTFGDVVARSVTRMMHDHHEEVRGLQSRLVEWMRKNGITSLDPNDPSIPSDKRLFVKGLVTHIPMKLKGVGDDGYMLERPAVQAQLIEPKIHTPALGPNGIITGYGEADATLEQVEALAKKREVLKEQVRTAKHEYELLKTKLETQPRVGTSEDNPMVGLDQVRAAQRRWEQLRNEEKMLPRGSASVAVTTKPVRGTYVGITSRQVDEWFEANPQAKEFLDLYKEQLDVEKRRVFYRADGTFDEQKAAKIGHTSAMDPDGTMYEASVGNFSSPRQGQAAYSVVNSELFQEAVRMGRIAPEEFERMFSEVVRLGIEEGPPGYFPRNTYLEKEMRSGVLVNSALKSRKDELDFLAGMSGRTKGITDQGLPVDPEFVKWIDEVYSTGDTKAAVSLAQTELDNMMNDLSRSPRPRKPMVHAPHLLDRALLQYKRDQAGTNILVSEAPAEVVGAKSLWRKEMAGLKVQTHSAVSRESAPSGPKRNFNTDDAGQMTFGSFVRGKKGRPIQVTEDWTNPLLERPVGGFRMVDYLEGAANSIRNPDARSKYLWGMRAIMGRVDRESYFLGNAVMESKKWVRSLAEGNVGTWLKEAGGGRLVDGLMKLSDPVYGPDSLSAAQGTLAKVLYSSHLGLNLASSVVNMMQPLTYGAMVYGWGPTARAFVDSVGEMGSYLNDRISKYGVRMISHEERLPLLQKHFKYSNQMGMDLEFMHQLDGTLYNGRVRPTGGLVDQVTEGVMKSFEMSERMNRAWTANIVARAHGNAGRAIDARALDEIGKAVRQFQFVSDPASTPQLFLGGVLSNPLLKMFTTFPTRATFTALNVMPNVFDKGSYLKGLGMSMVAGLGTSALVYELGKGMFGADLSRGLYAATATDLIGGEKFLESGNEWIPVPPVMDIPKDFLTGLAQGDKRAAADAVFRMFPGGVAFGKVISGLPAVPGLNTLQKGSVGWGQPLEDGRVPVYSADGRLVDFQSPSSIVFRSLGVDLGTGTRGSELDGYMSTQRDEILKYRKRYVDLLLANDMHGAGKVQAEFGKKFKDPVTKAPLKITVTQAQMKQAMEARRVPRPERMLNGLPPDVRQAFGQVLANTSPTRFNVAPQELVTKETAGQRQRLSADEVFLNGQ
jgi:hypothetical protein